ncbi:hypothetical protein C6A88_06440 [Mycolicibacterium austroafricanum]|uniref:Uncharacterized protein n=1 Tax=Mycolicibacterium hippocampi TaxID=659824 RepID=A0A850PRV3_9MYCO|nr:hypothetical protein [Mycolicibacterium hippocampi]PQP52194.1 hypothetical protein C6A88_06440 [Mycolicibacterium austroafricanum]PZT85660.1 MAG: hypothetical protein DI630_35835 [Gordonia sp. (in: high G+C Gram-positive bacteria)]
MAWHGDLPLPLVAKMYAEGGPEMSNRSITLTYEQLCAWAGRDLSSDEIDQLHSAIPFSSIPEAISTISDNLDCGGSV